MTDIRIRLGDHSYPILAGPGLIKHSGRLLADSCDCSHAVLVSSTKLLRLHGSALQKALKRAFPNCSVIRVGDGERHKNHAALLHIYEGLLRAGADRKTLLVAFGGGVIGDLAGYAAATYMRGIRYANIPTTLLAQVDSSVGGKVGINLPEGKNLVGAFHHPVAVVADTSVLGSLPPRELRAGLYEVIKCGAIRSQALIAFLENNLDGILKCRNSLLRHIVAESCRIKADVVMQDERENSVRAILNFGHTIGHALEASTNYRRYRHGEAVAWGMIGALAFGREMGLTGAKETARLATLIHKVGRLPGFADLKDGNVWTALLRDKKFREGRIRMVLLAAIGDARICDDVDPDRLKNFLLRFIAAKGKLN